MALAAFEGTIVFKSPVMLEEWIALDGFAADAAGGDGENKNGVDGSGEPAHVDGDVDNSDAADQAESYGMAMIAPMSISIEGPLDAPVWWKMNDGGPGQVLIDFSTLKDGALVANLSISVADLLKVSPEFTDAVLRVLDGSHFEAEMQAALLTLSMSCEVYYDGAKLGIQLFFGPDAITTANGAALQPILDGAGELALSLNFKGAALGISDETLPTDYLRFVYNGSSQHPLDIFPPTPPTPPPDVFPPAPPAPPLDADDPLVPDDPGSIDNPLDIPQRQLSFEQTSPFFAESLSGTDEWVDIPPGELNDWPAMGWEELDNPGWDNVEVAAALHQARLALGRLELSLAVLRDQGTEAAAGLDGGELAAFGAVLGEGDAMHARLADQIGVFENMIGRVQMIAPEARDGVMADLFESGAVGVLKAGHAADAMAGGIDAVTSLLRDGIEGGVSGDVITTAFAVTYAREQDATEAAGQRIDREDAEFNAHQARHGRGETKL